MGKGAEPEEKALERSIAEDALDQAYLDAFDAAKMAGWQRGGGTITEARKSCLAVLKAHFILKDATP